MGPLCPQPAKWRPAHRTLCGRLRNKRFHFWCFCWAPSETGHSRVKTESGDKPSPEHSAAPSSPGTRTDKPMGGGWACGLRGDPVGGRLECRAPQHPQLCSGTPGPQVPWRPSAGSPGSGLATLPQGSVSHRARGEGPPLGSTVAAPGKGSAGGSAGHLQGRVARAPVEHGGHSRAVPPPGQLTRSELGRVWTPVADEPFSGPMTPLFAPCGVSLYTTMSFQDAVSASTLTASECLLP